MQVELGPPLPGVRIRGAKPCLHHQIERALEAEAVGDTDAWMNAMRRIIRYWQYCSPVVKVIVTADLFVALCNVLREQCGEHGFPEPAPWPPAELLILKVPITPAPEGHQ